MDANGAQDNDTPGDGNTSSSPAPSSRLPAHLGTLTTGKEPWRAPGFYNRSALVQCGKHTNTGGKGMGQPIAYGAGDFEIFILIA